MSTNNFTFFLFYVFFLLVTRIRKPGQCHGIRNMEYGLRSSKYGERSTEYGARSTEHATRYAAGDKLIAVCHAMVVIYRLTQQHSHPHTQTHTHTDTHIHSYIPLYGCSGYNGIRVYGARARTAVRECACVCVGLPSAFHVLVCKCKCVCVCVCGKVWWVSFMKTIGEFPNSGHSYGYP